jgi:hypothetical protein
MRLSESSVPPTGVLPFPFISQQAGVEYMREIERVERGGSPGSRYFPSLYMGPMDPVDDARGVPTPLPGATCDVCLNRTGGTGPQLARWGTCILTRQAV